MAIELPGSFRESSILIETREGHQIENYQALEISQFELNQNADYERKWQRESVIFRTESNPIYNCHGLTFASRRTGIFNPDTLNLILEDDRYTRVTRSEVMPGDIVIYVAEDGDFEHSGIVVSSIDSTFKVPWVVSKWGKYREVLHWEHVTPYTYADVRYYRVIR